MKVSYFIICILFTLLNLRFEQKPAPNLTRLLKKHSVGNLEDVPASSFQLSSLITQPSRLVSVIVFKSSSNITSSYTFLNKFLQDIKTPVVITEINPKSKRSKIIDNFSEMDISYIIITGNVQNIDQIRDSQMIWNPRAKFLVHLFLDSCKLPKSEWADTLQKIWTKYFIANIFIAPIYPKNCPKQSKEIISFDPFTKTNAKIWGKPKFFTLQSFVGSTHQIIQTFSNLNGFTLKISMFERFETAMLLRPRREGISDEYYGPDAYTLHELSRVMNFTPETHEPADGEQYGDLDQVTKKYTGAIGEIVYGRADIAPNTRFLKNYSSEDITLSKPISSDKLCVIVPSALRIPKWLNMLRCFNTDMKFILLLMFILFPSLWCCFKALRNFYSKEHRKFDTILIYLESLQPFLNASLTHLPKPNSERFLMLCCIIFGFFIASTFQGRLVTILGKSIFYPEIDTLEELDKSNIKIVTVFSNLKDTFIKGTGNRILDNLNAKTKIEPLTKEIDNIYDLVAIKNVGAIVREGESLIRESDISSTGDPIFHIVSECPRNYYLTMMLPKTSPYLPKINDVITKIVEGGIFTKWEKDIRFELKLRARMSKGSRFTSKGTRKNKVFNLEDLQLAFMVLFVGLVLASVVFVMEIGFAFKRDKNRRTEFVH